LREQLAASGVRLVCCHTGRVKKSLAAAGMGKEDLFQSEDAALESCENMVLTDVIKGHQIELPPVSLADCTLFTQCDEAELALLERNMTHAVFSPGEPIIQTATKADELYVITQGTVEVRLRLEGERHQRLDVFSGGMSFGELAFLDGSPRSADVVAMTEVHCRVINRTFFEDLGIKLPALKVKILNEIALQLCDRLRLANIEISALRA
jgi:glutaminase